MNKSLEDIAKKYKSMMKLRSEADEDRELEITSISSLKIEFSNRIDSFVPRQKMLRKLCFFRLLKQIDENIKTHKLTAADFSKMDA